MNNIDKELNDLLQRYATLTLESWNSTQVFTWEWWFLAFIITIPWLIFIRYLDRNRALEVWSFGLLVILITSFVDDLGSELSLWFYPTKFVPVGLIEYPFDFSIIPLGFMLIYQNFNTWKTYIIALITLALIFAFIGEPISVWIGTVTYLKWKYQYSFVFYIVTGVIAKIFIQKLTPKS